MKLKKNREPIQQEQTKDIVDDVMKELDEDVMQQLSGAGTGNPFAGLPRVENQTIDSDLRNNG